MACQEAISLINAATITETGAASAQPLPQRKNKWAAAISTGTRTGTSPTLDVLVEHSENGTDWLTLATFTQITGASAHEVKFAAAATDYLKPLLPYARASYTVGGTGTPTFNSVTVKLFLDE